MYEISISGGAKKQLKKLDKFFQNRIGSVIERIKIRPFSHVKKLQGTKYYRLRVGDCRLILDIKNKEIVIIIIEVGHRRNIYKNFKN